MPVETYPKNSTTTSSFHGVERKEVYLKYLPKPDYLEFQLPATHVALVTNEGSTLTKEVVQALEQKGNKVVVLNLHNVENPYNSKTSIGLSNNEDATIHNTISYIESKFGKVGTFIHLHPHFEFQNGQFAQHFGTERELLKSVFLIAKHIQPSLNDLGKTNRANFLTVSRLDGQSGLGKRGNTSIVGGGLPGLVKCLNLEWSAVYCRAVDIQPELQHNTIAEHIIGELHDPNRAVVEVAINEGGRAMLDAKEVEVVENNTIQTAITSDSVFLVSGGARGVTANCVIEMAKAFQCKFILLGRSDFDYVVPEYAQQDMQEGALKAQIMNALKAQGEKPNLAAVKNIYKNIIAKKEIDDTIAKIEQNGGQAIYIKGDVTKISTVKHQLLPITQKWGNITGIIHGAGRLADKYIQDKSEQDFYNVLSVKLDGLLTLFQAVNIHKLDHLILFSSVAGFYGNVGQTDYAIANEILSKAAHIFRTNHPNTQVSAINWGAWDSGMVSAALKKKFQEMGVSLVSTEGGPAMLVNEMNVAYADQPQVIIGGTLPAGISYTEGTLNTHRIHRNLTLKANPFLMHHVIQGHAVLPVVNAVGWMTNTCEQVFPDFRVFHVEDAKLFKGLVFDGNQPENFVVELKETAKDADQIKIEATVLSQAPNAKLPTYHYKASITLVAKKNKVETPSFTPQISGNYTATDGSVLYQNGALFHDTYFRGIEQVLDWNESQIVLSCKAPTVPVKDQGQFPVISVNTFFADIQYQGMVIWVQQYNEGAKSLPLSTESCTIYESIPFEQPMLVHIEVVESSAHKMVANCTVYDETGKVYMVTTNAAVTVSKGLEW
ncbi:MAG: SDR family NAD(P)-dependent oxidoreductase [Aureispira sp.]|nr:SDR family NAD(P)-dependent oxidoreductase [Aureispira sp.]